MYYWLKRLFIGVPHAPACQHHWVTVKESRILGRRWDGTNSHIGYSTLKECVHCGEMKEFKFQL